MALQVRLLAQVYARHAAATEAADDAIPAARRAAELPPVEALRYEM